MADRSAIRHDEHDLLLVAALADRELADAEGARAVAQVEACAECARLHEDLVSLASATRELPAMPRSRDFTLRPEDARRLRPSLWRRLLAGFGTARDGFSRPLGMGLTTLGLAALLVGVVPGTLAPGGGPAGGPVEGVTFGAPADRELQMAGESITPDSGAGAGQPARASDVGIAASASPSPNLVVAALGLVLLAGGVAIFAARAVVRSRRGNHPADHPV